MSTTEANDSGAAATGRTLADAEARLFIDALPQLAWMAHPDGTVFWYNRRWYEYTGTTPEQMRTQGWELVHDPAELDRARARWRKCVDLRERFEMEFPLRGADGRFALFLTRAEPVRDAAGALRYWIGTSTDVAVHHEGQLTLRLALDAAYLVAFVWDIGKDEIRRYHNTDEMLRPTITMPDSLEQVKAYVHPDDREKFLANIEAALRDPRGAYESEFRFVGRDGQIRWVLDRGRVEFDAERRPLRLIGLSQDITGRKNAELRLTQAQLELQRHAVRLEAAVAERTARLQELVSELGTFSYSISHDLRAPLRSIQGFAELLREETVDQLSESARSHLDRIIRAAQRMDALIRDVLAYSRITRAELTIEDIDPAETLREAIDAHEQLQPAHAAIEIERPLPRVRASRPALLQCFSNLLSNAVKFVAPGVAPRVRVRAETTADTVRIWVEDNGIGIATQHQEKIWGMLERLNPNYEGTGVGLSIVRKAVERMGGRVGVVSAPGEGSRFWIELPKAEGMTESRVEG